MKKIILLYVLCIFGLSLYAQQVPNVLRRGGADSAECREWVEKQLSEMSLKEKIGQLFIHTVAPLNTQSNRANIYNAVKEYKVGGLLFSGGQVGNQAILTNYAQELSKVPLFIAFDGEWGLAMRLKNTPRFPRNRVLGCIQDNQLLYEYGKEVARQCKEIGVQINFAPVADVDINPRNPVINTRSFGGDPKNVAQKVVAYSRGLEDGGVLSVAKHFPGHGDTEVDSHKALPVLNFDRARLDSIELYPFKEVIHAGLGGIMAGHLEVPELGKNPASLSAHVIDNLLCRELGFRGLVFTDALEMKGVSQNENLCAKALKAGNDLLLAPRNLKRELNGVLEAVKSGWLSEKEITEKCRKVLTYKYALGLKTKPHVQISGLDKRLNRTEVAELISRLQKAAITVVNNTGGVLPLDAKLRGTTVLNIGKPSSGLEFYSRLKQYLPLRRIMATSDSMSAIRKELVNSQRVIVVINSNDYNKYKPMLEKLPDSLPVVYVYLMPLKTMSDMEVCWKKAAAVVLGHTDELEIQRQVADVMAGRAVADGRLSVAVSDLFKPGDGVTMSPKVSRIYKPEDYGMSSAVLKGIDEIALEGIKAKAYPGCQILILKDGVPVYDKCFGTHSVTDTTPVRATDLFDLASLTKTSATLLAVMKLYDQGRIELTDAVSKYVPALRATNKKNITIRELLLHESGLVPYIRFYRDAIDEYSVTGPFTQGFVDEWHHTRMGEYTYACSDFKFKKGLVSATKTSGHTLQIADGLWLDKKFKAAMMKSIAQSELDRKRFVYSDIGFILLQQVVEAVTGKTLDVYLVSEFYRPMGLEHTLFQPLNRYKKADIMPTAANDYLRRQDLCGYVHDEAAAFMGGVSGNAGLFSTAQELGKIYQMILNEGELDGKRYLRPETCRIFTTEKSAVSHRGLGYDKPNLKDPKANACASSAPASVYGHTGFTGTCAWVDPENDLVYIFLSNRLCPDAWNGKLNSMKIRQAVQEVIYQSLYTPE